MTAREWLKSTETKWDKYNYQSKLNAILLRSLYVLHDSAAADREELIAELEAAGAGALKRHGHPELEAIERPADSIRKGRPAHPKLPNAVDCIRSDLL